jgi:hypothetical protein
MNQNMFEAAALYAIMRNMFPVVIRELAFILILPFALAAWLVGKGVAGAGAFNIKYLGGHEPVYNPAEWPEGWADGKVDPKLFPDFKPAAVAPEQVPTPAGRSVLSVDDDELWKE